MVRQIATKRTPGWKALLAIMVAGGALLWHTLACVESPMAFSPSGKELAFVTMEPYGNNKGLSIEGTHSYRLMVLKDFDQLRIVEETTSHMLSAPAFSPDGKRICYLRIPLLTPAKLKRLEEALEKQKKLLKAPLNDGVDWPEEPTSQPTSGPWEHFDVENRTLPSAEDFKDFFRLFEARPLVPTVLVIRDAATDEVISTTPLELPIINYHEESDISHDLMLTYLTIRPQYSSDGKWVYLCSGDILLAVGLVESKLRILAVLPSKEHRRTVATLSPDGKTLATLQAGKKTVLGFFATDRPVVTYTRALQEKEVSMSGIGWVDSQTLAVLSGKSGKDGKDELHLIRIDGTVLKTINLKLPKHAHNDGNTGQLAISPNGKYAVISFNQDVFFMSMDGEILKHWHHEDDLLVQPTFTPDSTKVAFKYMDTNENRTGAIVFFTPDGNELSSVNIPPIDPATTRPASQPATQASK